MIPFNLVSFCIRLICKNVNLTENKSLKVVTFIFQVKKIHLMK